MNFTLEPLSPLYVEDALTLLRAASEKGEVLYKPLEKSDYLERFQGPGCAAFAAMSEGRLIGWVHAAWQTSFLPGEDANNTPLYLTLLVVDARHRRQGVGRALLHTVSELGRSMHKKHLVVSSNNPVHLTWLIPGAGGHDHNNAPGVNEETPGYAYLLHQGFHDDFHEISMYINLKDYHWDPALDDKIAALAAEGIRVGRWEPGLGEDYNGMCDRVGSEYWRNVLCQELTAWHEHRPNSDPECWPDGRKPAGPRVLLTATKDDQIIGFTGPVDLQQSGRGWFTGICTDPAWGGRGIASVLFNLLMKEFIAEGAAFTSLFTGKTNFAQKIYLGAGLRITSNWAVMSLPLADGEKYDKKYF